MWQAQQTKQLINQIGINVDIQIIKTKGDQIQHLSFDKIEGKGFFTKEIEEALLRKEIDCAVHSMKDLPTQMDQRLVVAGVSDRANPADWIVIRRSAFDQQKILRLQTAAIVGTSSARRKAQLMAIRPDLTLKDIRGNVPTRINKLEDGSYDAIVLAAAGITRLNISLHQYEVVKLHPREFIPAPGQGVLAYQSRSEDHDTRIILEKLHRSKVAALTDIERTILSLFDGGCHLPLGAYCECDSMGNYHVWAAYSPGLNYHPIRRSKLSLNTTQGLAEGVFKNLTKDH